MGTAVLQAAAVQSPEPSLHPILELVDSASKATSHQEATAILSKVFFLVDNGGNDALIAGSAIVYTRHDEHLWNFWKPYLWRIGRPAILSLSGALLDKEEPGCTRAFTELRRLANNPITSSDVAQICSNHYAAPRSNTEDYDLHLQILKFLIPNSEARKRIIIELFKALPQEHCRKLLLYINGSDRSEVLYSSLSHLNNVLVHGAGQKELDCALDFCARIGRNPQTFANIMRSEWRPRGGVRREQILDMIVGRMAVLGMLPGDKDVKLFPKMPQVSYGNGHHPRKSSPHHGHHH
jgi:hypothetical protein